LPAGASATDALLRGAPVGADEAEALARLRHGTTSELPASAIDASAYAQVSSPDVYINTNDADAPSISAAWLFAFFVCFIVLIALIARRYRANQRLKARGMRSI
jgi:hypothetical protein